MQNKTKHEKQGKRVKVSRSDEQTELESILAKTNPTNKDIVTLLGRIIKGVN